MKRKNENFPNDKNEAVTTKSRDSDNVKALYYLNKINAVHDLRQVLLNYPESEPYVLDALLNDKKFYNRIIMNESCLELAFNICPNYKKLLSTKFLTDINFLNWLIKNSSYKVLEKIFTLLLACLNYVSDKFSKDPDVLDYVIIDDLDTLEIIIQLVPISRPCMLNKFLTDANFLDRFLVDIDSLERLVKILPGLRNPIFNRLQTDSTFFNRIVNIDNRSCLKIVTTIFPSIKDYISNKLETDSDFFNRTAKNGFCVVEIIEALPSCRDYISNKLLTDFAFFTLIIGSDEYYLKQMTTVFLSHRFALHLNYSVISGMNPEGLLEIFSKIKEDIDQDFLTCKSLQLFCFFLESVINAPIMNKNKSAFSQSLISLYDYLLEKIFKIRVVNPLRNSAHNLGQYGIFEYNSSVKTEIHLREIDPPFSQLSHRYGKHQ